MITQENLTSWRLAKNLAVTSFTVEPEITIAIQEMYIEAKALRRENLRLLNKQDLFDKLLGYVSTSASEHYLTEELEDALSVIRDLCDNLNIELEV